MIRTLIKLFAYITLLTLLAGTRSDAQVIIADNFNVSGNGTGFAINNGVNSGIAPPTTRLTGTMAPNLRYITTGNKPVTAFSIATNKLTVMGTTNFGRFTLSADGATPFNFASALRSTTATPANPVVYDLLISMANHSSNIARFSFAIGTVESDASNWDFSVQLYRNALTDNYYTIGTRIDTGSSGLASDINTYITNTAEGTFGSEMHFRVRVTDAGAQTTGFNSRVQLSIDDGVTWLYDTDTDPRLLNGWRFDAAGRYLIWDVAPNAGPVTYDNFSVVPVPASVGLVGPADGAKSAGAPVLKVAVTNQFPSDVTVTFYGREAPKPYPGQEFCIAVLPDTQNYAREAPDNASRQMWYAQTDWIVRNRVKENIVYVAHLGDIVQSGDIKNGSPNSIEWNIATNAMYRLEKESSTLLPQGIPYGMAVGNHDQEPIGDENGASAFFNDYFGVDHFNGRHYYGGNFSSNNDSHFDLFSASGVDFVVLYFEYGRFGSGVIDWANAVLATNQHRRAFVVTHHAGGTGTPNNLSTQGQAIYDGLKHNTNFFMMLGGHISGEGSRQNTFNGTVMRTFVSDYQGRTNGGDGWMRLMYFSPTNNQVVIQTYNPWLDKFETDANSEMFFNYPLRPGGAGSPGTPYVALATNFNVASGTLAAATWPTLQANKTYNWYVKLTDPAGNTLVSPTWTFTTTNNIAPSVPTISQVITGDRPTALNLVASDINGDPVLFSTFGQANRGITRDLNPITGSITYVPAHGFRGLDQFAFRAYDSRATSALVNFHLNVVAPPDTSANGIPDSWEAAYGISDPDADNDGDGHTNREEYAANTNPTNAASRFRILDAAFNTNGYFGVSWSSVGGTRYRVQSSGDLTNAFTDIIGSLEDEMDTGPYGTAGEKTFVDDSGSGTTNSQKFYRVKVNP